MQDRPKGFTPEERELVAQARGGDYEAFERLVTRHAGGVYHLALKMVHNPADAEEVLQETFLSAHRHLDSFRGEASFKNWLYRIAANQALSRLRKDKHQARLWGEEPEEGWDRLPGAADWSANPEEIFQREELRRVLLQAVEALPAPYRTVFWLRDVEGLSTQEVADVLQLAVPNVKSRLLRARLKLRELLGDYVKEGVSGGSVL